MICYSDWKAACQNLDATLSNLDRFIFYAFYNLAILFPSAILSSPPLVGAIRHIGVFAIYVSLIYISCCRLTPGCTHKTKLTMVKFNIVWGCGLAVATAITFIIKSLNR
jgi:hypothetical protein